jgi:hypothetical protein
MRSFRTLPEVQRALDAWRDRDGNYGIFFASWQVALIDLTNGQPVSDVSEQVSAMSPG